MLRLLAVNVGPADLSTSRLDDGASFAEEIALPSETFSCHSLISHTLVRIGAHALPDLIIALDDPELRYTSAEILSRMRPTPKELVPKVVRWLDEENPAGVLFAVRALHMSGVPEARGSILKGTATLKAVLRAGCKFSPASALDLAETIGQVGDMDFACQYYASVLRGEPVFADFLRPSGPLQPGGPLSAPLAFRGLVRLGPQAIPTIKEFVHDRNWETRFMAHVALRLAEEQTRTKPQQPRGD
jgi:hypothetical protein